jgi:uncharacterized protein
VTHHGVATGITVGCLQWLFNGTYSEVLDLNPQNEKSNARGLEQTSLGYGIAAARPGAVGLDRARGANQAARGLQQWAYLCFVPRMLSPSLSRLASLVILLSAGQPATAGDFRSGLSAYNRGDYITAFRDWYPLAEHGDAPSQTGLGFLFHKGLGVTQDDIEAAYWFEKAASKGQAEAQLLLGTLYFFGEGVQQNYVMAFAWCEIAQSNGQSDALECRDAALEHMTNAEIEQSFRLVTEWQGRHAFPSP